MSQKYVLVARKNPLKPLETAKFYATAHSNRKVDTDEVIKRISERSSYSIGELKGCITEFLLEIKNQLELGNIVILGDLGRFRVTIVTGTATKTAKEFKASSCIKISRVRFHPGSMLMDMCKAMKYSLIKAGKEEGDDDDVVDPNPNPNPNPGGGDEEAPDPTV